MDGTVTVNLASSRSLSNQTELTIDCAVAFYVTKYANLAAVVGDFSGPVGIVAQWNALIGKTSSQYSLDGSNERKQITGGITKFSVTKSKDGKRSPRVANSYNQWQASQWQISPHKQLALFW